MVEPLDAQNLFSRTPLVEKTAAAQRDQAAHLNLPARQMEKDAQHMPGGVEMHRQVQKTEDRDPGRSGQGNRSGSHGTQADAPSPIEVTEVQEEAETPAHELDITI
ncbi:MAG: hypothetical protein AB1439_10580 [candidate division FCPU426 bacterium]